MPPEISGADISEKLRVTDSMRDYIQTMNEMAMANQAGYSSLSLMLETMHKSHYSFTEFMSILEKTNVVLYTTARAINELGQNIKGATSSVEGLISAFGMLGGKVMPEMAHHIAMATRESMLNIDALNEQKESYQGQIKVLQENKLKLDDAIKSMQHLGLTTQTEKKLFNDLNNQFADMEDNEKDLIKNMFDIEEEITKASETMSKFSQTITKILGPVTLAITTGLALAQAYDTSIKAKREVIYTLGRLGESYGENTTAMEEFNKEFTSISSKWGMLREEMAKAVAPLSAMGVGGAGTITTIEDIVGGMFKGFGVDMGSTVKSLGTFSTSLNLHGKALGDTFLEIAGHGQKSALHMQRYIAEMTTAMETTRRFGGGTEGAMLMLDAFGEEVKKGTISMQDLSKIITPAMWSLPQQGAVAAMMGRFAPKEAADIGITGKSLTDDILAMQRAAGDKDKSKALAFGMGKLLTGLSGGGTEGDQAVKAQMILQQLTGVQVPLLDAVNTLKDPEKLKKAMEGGFKPITLQGMMDSFKPVESFSERAAVGVEMFRDYVLYIWNPAGLESSKKAGKMTIGEREDIAGKMSTLGMDTSFAISPSSLKITDADIKAARGMVKEGRGATLNIGDVHIGVAAGGGDLKVQIREQLDKFTDHILGKVDEHVADQWTVSQNSH